MGCWLSLIENPRVGSSILSLGTIFQYVIPRFDFGCFHGGGWVTSCLRVTGYAVLSPALHLQPSRRAQSSQTILNPVALALQPSGCLGDGPNRAVPVQHTDAGWWIAAIHCRGFQKRQQLFRRIPAVVFIEEPLSCAGFHSFQQLRISLQ